MSGALVPDYVAAALVAMHPFLLSTVVAMNCPEAHVDLELLLFGFLLASTPGTCNESVLVFDFVLFSFFSISRFAFTFNTDQYTSFPSH